MEELFAGQAVNIPQMLARLKQTARDLGLPFGDRMMTFNSRKAQEVGKWAEAQGRGDAFHHAAFRAYFEQGRNIAQLDVLKTVASVAGLNGETVETVLGQAPYREAVDRDWQRSRQMGITAVPAFHYRGDIRVGAQSYAALEQWLLESGALTPRYKNTPS